MRSWQGRSSGRQLSPLRRRTRRSWRTERRVKLVRRVLETLVRSGRKEMGVQRSVVVFIVGMFLLALPNLASTQDAHVDSVTIADVQWIASAMTTHAVIDQAAQEATPILNE